VRHAGRRVPLRPKEYELLRALVERGGAVASRRELLIEVFGYRNDVNSRTVDTHVAVLRRKLGHRPEEPGFIVTVAKAGYRLLSP
jgi:DNA-binding response OmpR family regulator